MWHRLRTRLLQATESPCVNALLTILEATDWRIPQLLRVITYHRVDEWDHRTELDPSTLSASPSAFEQQMGFLTQNYKVISMQTAVNAATGKEPLPDRAVLITFDDAYQDFAENAWPILRRFAIPATLFVPTGYPNNPDRVFWWDRLYQAVVVNPQSVALSTPKCRLLLRSPEERHSAFRWLKQWIKRLPHHLTMAQVEQICNTLASRPSVSHVLSWDELRSLAQSGLTLAPHTRTHPLLNRVDADQCIAEVNGSICDLERHVGPTLPVFAYPDGATSTAAEKALRRAGVSLAFTTTRGINRIGKLDPLRLLRINIGRQTSLSLLRLQLLPCSAFLSGRIRPQEENLCRA